MPEPATLALLRERASLQPNDVAYAYTDYDVDFDGVTTTLTWAQIHRRVINVAIAVAEHGSPGDRAVILLPQGLDYVASFFGAMQAGFIAVPLSTPSPGSHDERVSSVLADTRPAVLLTTAAIAPTLSGYFPADGPTPAVVAVDALDLDVRNGSGPRVREHPKVAYLQYTSGSTRTPAGVMISDRNLQVNFGQLMGGYFPHLGGVGPPDTTIVSWLPFYHDMGLILGVVAPVLSGYRAELTNPLAFLGRPARWIQRLASGRPTFGAGPNFAFELAVKKTTAADLDGHDLSNVQVILNGAERVHPATMNRFMKRFEPMGLPARAITPSYGMAEAVVYLTTKTGAGALVVTDFDSDKLAANTAERVAPGTGSPLVSYLLPTSPQVRIVDAETRREVPAGTVGEIWVRGENVALGYWEKPAETEATFGGTIVEPSSGTEAGPWLRTGDLGFVSEDELFIVGRIKDLLIVYGRNHYAEDIEATVQEISGGRVAAISVDVDHSERLVTIVELKKRGTTDEEVRARYDAVKNEVTSALSRAHGLTVADLVLVEPGAIPITTSGKIRRATCVEHYQNRQFARLDA